MDLFELRDRILYNLRDDLKKQRVYSSDLPEFCCTIFNIPTIDFIDLISKIEHSPVGYFKERQNIFQYLFLGANRTFSNIDQMDDIIRVASSNSHLNLFGGITFDPQEVRAKEWKVFGQICFLLPMIQLKQESSKSQSDSFTLECQINYPKEILFNQKMADEFILKIKDCFLKSSHIKNSAQKEKGPDRSIKELHPSKDQWNRQIDICLDAIRKDEIEKIVLARKQTAPIDGALSTVLPIMLNKLSSNENSYLFMLRPKEGVVFISNTPERLYKRDHLSIEMDSIAGTRPRGRDKKMDLMLEEELNSSTKDLNEHRLVTENILKKLEPLCDSFQMESREKILKLKHVQHIKSTMKGSLKLEIDDHCLLKEVHPTPAVGGHPWPLAKNIIKKTESFDRGLYAAPLGLISKERTEFIVGIRSALIENQCIHTYGGAGIVEGSNGDAEWMETENKMENFQLILNER